LAAMVTRIPSAVDAPSLSVTLPRRGLPGWICMSPTLTSSLSLFVAHSTGAGSP
jgi:hypothetical protein